MITLIAANNEIAYKFAFMMLELPSLFCLRCGLMDDVHHTMTEYNTE